MTTPIAPMSLSPSTATSSNSPSNISGQPSDAQQMRRLMVQQQREAAMLQRLQRQAQPPKNRLEAIGRSAFDGTSVAFDLAAGAIFSAGMAIWKLVRGASNSKPWTWPLLGFAVVPFTMAIRGLTAAVTGKAHGQESAQRILASMGMQQGAAPQTGTPAPGGNETSQPALPATPNNDQSQLAAQPTGSASPGLSPSTVLDVPGMESQVVDLSQNNNSVDSQQAGEVGNSMPPAPPEAVVPPPKPNQQPSSPLSVTA